MLGQRVLRKEDPRFLRGEGRYVENLRFEDALHVAFVRSPVSHATHLQRRVTLTSKTRTMFSATLPRWTFARSISPVGQSTLH